MPKTRLIALAANTGAWTAVAATITARSVQIVEDGAVAAQGIAAQFPGDGFTVTDTYEADAPITITGAGHDGICGLPEQNAAGAFNYRPADVYCKLRSATSTATKVRVVECEG